jgi:propanediol dehydratase large subunit
VKKETGIEPQIWAARSIAKVFEKLNLPYDRTEKTSAPSFTKNFLQNHPHPVVQHIARAREINKAHTTFIDTILKYSHKGRIHAEINQLREIMEERLLEDSHTQTLIYSKFLLEIRNLDP